MRKIHSMPSFEQTPDKVQVLFFMDEDMKREFKIYATRHRTTMSDILNSYVAKLLENEKRLSQD